MRLDLQMDLKTPPANDPRPSRVISAAISMASVVLAVSLVSCSPPEGEARPAGAAPGAVAQLAAPVAVAKARTGDIASYYSATATLEVEKEAQILARVSGLIRSILVEEGDEVRKDAPLLEIDNEEYSFRLNQSRARRAFLESKHARLVGISREIVSVEEIDTARNELETARADEALAQLQLSYTTVTATFDGRLVRRLVDVGQNVSVGTPLFVVADFHPLLARVHVPAKEFTHLRTDQTVELSLDSKRARSPEDARVQGRVTLVSPIIDPTTGTIKVTVEIAEYPDDTRPGDFVEVDIVTERRQGVTLVPKSAVFTDRGEQVVFVAAGELAERRVVETGFTDDSDAEIVRGVNVGERVIVQGQRSLKHGARIKVLREETDGRTGQRSVESIAESRTAAHAPDTADAAASTRAASAAAPDASAAAKPAIGGGTTKGTTAAAP